MHSCEIYVNEDIVNEIYSDLEAGGSYPWSEIKLHTDKQDTDSHAWKLLLETIEEAFQSECEKFSPGKLLGANLWSKIFTLPASIGKLKKVKEFDLYGSNLISIPPEIGEMENMEIFMPYTSYGLHWFPFEIMHCRKLKNSTVSTRALYGNYKYRPPFPALEQQYIFDYLKPKKCSVCGAYFQRHQIKQVWVSLAVATDVLPLLVNACSDTCIQSLPACATGYVMYPHKGGSRVIQPNADW